MKRPNAKGIFTELERRRLHEAEETRRIAAAEEARTAEATQLLMESTYRGLDDLEVAHRRSEGRESRPRV